MNITFLIGNGFDLGLGLKTTYASFYEKYCVEKETDSKAIKNFKSLLKERKPPFADSNGNWSDFELAFGSYSMDFTVETKSEYIECYEDFVIAFNGYIEAENKKVDYSNMDAIKKQMTNATSSFYHIRNEDSEILEEWRSSFSSHRLYNFLSFNYTDCVDTFAEALRSVIVHDATKKVAKVVHVHGRIEDNMLIGVNDPSQILKEEFAKDPEIIAEIVKPEQNRNAKMNYDKNATSVINSSDLICVYGMSIGETDKKWWDLISKWLLENSRRHLVILVHDENYSSKYNFLVKKSNDKILNSFLKCSTLNQDEKNIIANRIHIGFNHDIFSIDLYKKTEEMSCAAN